MINQIFVGVVTAGILTSAGLLFKSIKMLLGHEYKIVEYDERLARHDAKLNAHDKRLDNHDIRLAVTERGGQHDYKR